MGVATTLAASLGIVRQAVIETQNEILALSEAYAAAQKKIRDETDATVLAMGGRSGTINDGDSSLTGGGTSGIFSSGSSSSGGGSRRGGGGSGSRQDFGGRVRNRDTDNRRVQPGFDPSRGPFGRPGPFSGSSAGSSVYVRDEGTANEIRGLRGDLRKNGGIL